MVKALAVAYDNLDQEEAYIVEIKLFNEQLKMTFPDCTFNGGTDNFII
jgi:hypothetical protein